MTEAVNKAIWLEPDGSLTAKDLNTSRTPGKGQAKIRVLYSGINPADSKHAMLGIHTTVSGYDFCGVVEEAGEGCRYKVGDVIAGFTPTGLGRPDYFGTHQNYLIYPDDGLAWKVPSHMDQKDAASIMVVVRTAADTLFNLFQYPLPSEKSDRELGPVLIWGGASSLGSAAIQFAKAVGVSTIITTASPSNHQMLIDLGADKCFDYKDENVAENIKAYLAQSNLELRNVLDAIGSREAKTADTAASCAVEDALVVCATAHAKFRMPFAISDTDIELIVPGQGPTTIPARVEDSERAQTALLWAVENYGTRFKMPKITVVSGQVNEAIKAIAEVGDSRARFGKFVIEHPLYD